MCHECMCLIHYIESGGDYMRILKVLISVVLSLFIIGCGSKDLESKTTMEEPSGSYHPAYFSSKVLSVTEDLSLKEVAQVYSELDDYAYSSEVIDNGLYVYFTDSGYETELIYFQDNLAENLDLLNDKELFPEVTDIRITEDLDEIEIYVDMNTYDEEIMLLFAGDILGEAQGYLDTMNEGKVAHLFIIDDETEKKEEDYTLDAIYDRWVEVAKELEEAYG